MCANKERHRNTQTQQKRHQGDDRNARQQHGESLANSHAVMSGATLVDDSIQMKSSAPLGFRRSNKFCNALHPNSAAHIVSECSNEKQETEPATVATHTISEY